MTEYLRQLNTGRLYIHSDALAKRKDMVSYDPDSAEKRIEAAKTRLADLKEGMDTPKVPKEVLDQAKELTEVENEISAMEKARIREESGTEEPEQKTDAEIEAERRQNIIDNDPEISKIERMRSENSLTSYLAAEYGVAVEEGGNIDDLKKQAVQLRIDRLFEE